MVPLGSLILKAAASIVTFFFRLDSRTVVESLLFLSREDAESSPLEFERIELNDWLAEHLASWKSHPRYNDLGIDTDASEPLWISAHAGLLGQAIDNLLDNACKYSEPGSTIRVRSA